MRGEKYFTRTAFFDLLFNTLLIFIVLFIIALVQIKPEQKQEEKSIKLDQKFMIIVSWTDGIDDDVDTYVLDPDHHLVYFRRLQDGLMHLERDDIGLRNDTIFGENGEQIQIPKNEEHVYLRGIVPGEYVVNIHMYLKNEDEPTPVTIRLIKLMGQDIEITKVTKMLGRNGEETTAFRFTLDEEGNVSDINEDFRSLYEFRYNLEGF